MHTDRHAFVLRPARDADFDAWFDLFAAVAAEGKWIGREPPLDREEQRRRFQDACMDNDGSAIAVMAEAEADAGAGGRPIGELFVRSHDGIGDLGMLVAADWRGRGVGTALMAAAIEWARQRPLHKLTLQLWTHNVAALGLYQKFGFVEEGLLIRHYRRRSGELWDAIVMGLVLDTASPGSLLG